MREGGHKLMEFLHDGHVDLYNIATDISETTDLAAARPEIAAALQCKLHEWRVAEEFAKERARQGAAAHVVEELVAEDFHEFL